ncbi:MAG: hypothetical protein ACR2PB_13865 [Desulfocapsaceae bacterium]
MKHILVWFLSCLLLVACSEEEEEARNESAIDRATKEVATTVVEQIKTPLEKAEAVKELEEQRTDRMEEQIK